jgi:hypothetical protein
MNDSAKPKKMIVHVIKRQDRWAVRKHGASRVSKIYQSKEEAVKGAQKLKRKGYDLVIHKKDGSIQRWEESEISI